MGGALILPAFQRDFGLLNLSERELNHLTCMAQWQIPIGIQLLPGALMLLATPFCPETPRWLCSRNRFAAAEAALCRVRGMPCEHPYVAREMREMRAEVARESDMMMGQTTLKAKLKGLARRGVRNRVGIGLGLMMAHNMTGVGIVIYYSPRIFASLGIRTTDLKLFATGFYGVAKTLGTLVFMFWVADRLGRRKGFVYGAFIGAVPMFYIGAYILKADPADPAAAKHHHAAAATSSAWGYLAIICIYVLAVICSASWGGHHLALCMSLTIANERVWSFVITRSTPYMITDMGYGGLPIEEMDALFGASRAQDLVVEGREEEEGKGGVEGLEDGRGSKCD
ncbi:putative quinate permease [Diplodia seriata]|uniref:Putative quinate permease n=1 Tax=Diplodia seriata TaxID=420778 RepID=A0A0G2DZ09_9PEZI|nr:putative quinate permease [Diplodia seriata]